MFCSAVFCFPPKPRPVPHPVYRPYPVRPLGAPIHIGRAYPVLPLGYVAFMVSGALFYSHAGNYYRRTPAGYVVIADPTHGAPRQQVVLSENRKVITRALNVRNGPGVQNAINFDSSYGYGVVCYRKSSRVVLCAIAKRDTWLGHGKIHHCYRATH